MDGGMNGWIDGCMNEWIIRMQDRQTEGRTDRQKYHWKDRQAFRYIDMSMIDGMQKDEWTLCLMDGWMNRWRNHTKERLGSNSNRN